MCRGHYKNFKSDPLDWPLLCFQWRDEYFCDVTMPFGARSSSCHMQRVAEAIVWMLAQRGVTARMYLDDIITISPTKQRAVRDLEIVQKLLADLGLPEAIDKVQHPDTSVTWLGVNIDSVAMTLSIPQQKLREVQIAVKNALKCKAITKKHLQSLLGRLLHVAKCIKPARLFVSRLLEALRNAKGRYIRVNQDMKRDLLWFREFCHAWNGNSLVQTSTPSRCISVDASGSGIGGTDGQTAYRMQLTASHDPVANICELEAANVVVAIHTFISEKDRGAHILVNSDSMAAVQVFTTGRGKNKVLLDLARHLWMVQSILDIKITYHHIPGNENVIADALSRAHMDQKSATWLNGNFPEMSLSYVPANLSVFATLSEYLYCRSGIPILAAERR